MFKTDLPDEDRGKRRWPSSKGGFGTSPSGRGAPARLLKYASSPSSVTVTRRSTRNPQATNTPSGCSSSGSFFFVWLLTSTQTPSTTATRCRTLRSRTSRSRRMTTAQPFDDFFTETTADAVSSDSAFFVIWLLGTIPKSIVLHGAATGACLLGYACELYHAADVCPQRDAFWFWPHSLYHEFAMMQLASWAF